MNLRFWNARYFTSLGVNWHTFSCFDGSTISERRVTVPPEQLQIILGNVFRDLELHPITFCSSSIRWLLFSTSLTRESASILCFFCSEGSIHLVGCHFVPWFCHWATSIRVKSVRNRELLWNFSCLYQLQILLAQKFSTPIFINRFGFVNDFLWLVFFPYGSGIFILAQSDLNTFF